uniref:MIP22154p n=1 Tax=Drosophila melanogaster TaxID=7227 RepID=D5SHL4_DROME|nr:MIP22154p [Drosophila melanogaster]
MEWCASTRTATAPSEWPSSCPARPSCVSATTTTDMWRTSCTTSAVELIFRAWSASWSRSAHFWRPFWYPPTCESISRRRSSKAEPEDVVWRLSTPVIHQMCLSETNRNKRSSYPYH